MKNKPVAFYGPIAPPVPNDTSLECPRASIAARQSEYPTKRLAAAAVPLPESL